MTLAAFLAALFATAVAGGLFTIWHRARGARRALSLALHERSLGLDRRADALGARIEHLELGLALARLAEKTALARRRGLLSASAANRIETLVLAWQGERRTTAACTARASTETSRPDPACVPH